jgi:hypothetical protein
MGGHVVNVGEMRKAYRLLIVKPEGKRPLERTTHRWEEWILGKQGGRVWTG